MSTLIEKVTGPLHEKRRWRQYKARVRALPRDHRVAAEAVERYASHLGALTTGDLPADGLMDLFEQSVSRVERAAADGASAATAFGDDPVGFVDSLVETHLGGRWTSAAGATVIERDVHAQLDRGIAKERARLLAAVGRPGASTGARR